ncbi:MAG: heavy metal translocating P-type ATPase, partial [Firmicutes bacterium]|nr:heavy metal translocating P-type ATPase [Bacillota bacterium]
MEQYNVTGMSCAACQARVEKAVAKVPGVSSVAVSLLTNSMGVEGSASPEDIIKAVEDAGYGASLKETAKSTEKRHSGYEAEEEALRDKETPLLKKRLIASVGFLIVLMYISMGHMMWGWPLPSFLDGNHVAMGIAQMLLAVIVMVINQRFFISGFKAVLHGAPNMDTLVAMGSMASFVWSTYALFAMTGAVMRGDHEAVMTYMHEFYFESAAMIVTLITVGKMLEAKSKGRTTDALKSLMKLAPSTATVIRGGAEVTVPIDDVETGDIFTVRPGENVPVDGVVVEGASAVNEAALTGESLPVDKSEGSNVSAGTVNQSGFLKCRATKVGRDTTLSQIIQMVSDASATKAPIAKIADKVSGVFVPVVLGIALLTAAVWMIFGKGIGAGAEKWGFALARAISVLVISCPCALGLATPVAIMVGSGMGAKSGILFKTAVSIEETGKTQIVVLDKTGTITEGQPKVTDILPSEGVSEEELLLKAAALEKKSEHPLAKAVNEEAENRKLSIPETSDFTSLTESGVRASLEGKELLGGSASYMNGTVGMSREMLRKAEALADLGKTPLVFAEGGKILGIIAVADTIKEDSARAIGELRGMGIRTVMLTGDNERTAREIAKQAGVDAVCAGLLPDGKEEIVRKLKSL